MKSEKRDADRQQDLEKRQLVLQSEQCCELVRRRYKKIEVFERAEQGQMKGNRNPDKKASSLPVFGR